MYKKNRILAVITARGGSKRLPGKNIKPLRGKPLIAWTIEAAKGSRYIDRIIVSTDDKKITAISLKYGAETPFMRPPRLAQDMSKSVDAVLHTIDWMKKKEGVGCDLVILLQPTSPLRSAADIDGAVDIFFSKNAASVVSVCDTGIPCNITGTLAPDDRMVEFGRMKGKTSYRINGAIYLTREDYIKRHKTFIGKRTFAYIMPKSRSVDIDDEFDFKLAEFLLMVRGRKEL